MKKESMSESLKIVQQNGMKAVIYDSTTKKYILVDHEGGIYSNDTPDELLKMLEIEEK